MAISLKRFDSAEVTPKDDAIMFNHMMIGGSGIISGCEVTHMGGTQLRVAAGRGVILGRDFVVTQTDINAVVSPSGTQQGRLLIRIDTANLSEPIAFVTQVGATLPALTQEDINGSGSVYELLLATYNISETLITNFAFVGPEVPSVKEHASRHASGGEDPITPADIGAAASTHNHNISNVSGLQSALDGKAATSHEHSISNVTGLQSALNAKEGTLNADQKRKITISTSDPSGGNNGDIWLKIIS